MHIASVQRKREREMLYRDKLGDQTNSSKVLMRFVLSYRDTFVFPVAKRKTLRELSTATTQRGQVCFTLKISSHINFYIVFSLCVECFATTTVLFRGQGFLIVFIYRCFSL